MNRIVAYRLVPVQEIQEGGIATAAVMTCMVTGRTLSGMGGGGSFIAPEVVDALRRQDVARAVCDAPMLDAMIEMTSAVARGEDRSVQAREIMAGWPDAFV